MTGRDAEGAPAEAARILARPEAYPGRPARVEIIETHISRVYLAGDRAYKVKKPVRFPFLDYSTAERRRHFCEEEVRLNRRLAPEVYRGVVPVTADGRIGGTGAVLEYAVEMVRLPQERMLDRLLEAGTATPAAMEAIADRLAAFHAGAERVEGYGHPEQVRRVVAANLDDARRFLPGPWRDRIARDQMGFLDAHGALLERRVREGRVRDGHGDLHAQNVCLPGDRVVIYDCIEFEPAFRCGDVAGEVAFLAMDCERRGAWALARAFVDRYVARSGDEGLRALLPLYRRHRACVRGLVESLHEPPRAAAARDYFRLAASYGAGPFLLLTCGLPGTGKSTLARAVAAAFGAAVLRSDLVRKELAGIPATRHWSGGYLEGPYDPALTARTYDVLLERAGALLRHGERVVVDATFPRRDLRDRFRARAQEAGVPGLVCLLDCPEEEVRRRLAARAGDAAEVSDAGVDVYILARRAFETPARPDLTFEAGSGTGELLDALLDRLIGAA